MDYLNYEKIVKQLFTDYDIIDAVNQCNDKKALGEDWFTVSLLKDKELGSHLRAQLVKMLNEDATPDYLKHSRLVLLSKSSKTTASFADIRPIAVLT